MKELTYQELKERGEKAISPLFRSLFVDDPEMCSCLTEKNDCSLGNISPATPIVYLDNDIPKEYTMDDALKNKMVFYVPLTSSISDDGMTALIKKACQFATPTPEYMIKDRLKEKYTFPFVFVGRYNRLSLEKYIYLDIDEEYVLPSLGFLGAYIYSWAGFGAFCFTDDILKIDN